METTEQGPVTIYRHQIAHWASRANFHTGHAALPTAGLNPCSGAWLTVRLPALWPPGRIGFTRASAESI